MAPAQSASQASRPVGMSYGSSASVPRTTSYPNYPYASVATSSWTQQPAVSTYAVGGYAEPSGLGVSARHPSSDSQNRMRSPYGVQSLQTQSIPSLPSNIGTDSSTMGFSSMQYPHMYGRGMPGVAHQNHSSHMHGYDVDADSEVSSPHGSCASGDCLCHSSGASDETHDSLSDLMEQNWANDMDYVMVSPDLNQQPSSWAPGDYGNAINREDGATTPTQKYHMCDGPKCTKSFRRLSDLK